MIVADTSGLLAFFNCREPAHPAVARHIASSSETLVVSPYVVAELDYLIATRLGSHASLVVLRELASGAYEHAAFSTEDLLVCADIIERYHDLEIGVADASLVVLARRFHTRSILTLDHRHFSVLRPLDGGRFKLVPGSR